MGVNGRAVAFPEKPLTVAHLAVQIGKEVRAEILEDLQPAIFKAVTEAAQQILPQLAHAAALETREKIEKAADESAKRIDRMAKTLEDVVAKWDRDVKVSYERIAQLHKLVKDSLDALIDKEQNVIDTIGRAVAKVGHSTVLLMVEKEIKRYDVERLIHEGVVSAVRESLQKKPAE